jgi:hypothetical protein
MVAMTIVFVFAFSYVKEPQGLIQVLVAAIFNPEAAKSSAPTPQCIFGFRTIC